MKITVISICLNNEGLEKTINSVIDQTCKYYEYLIIDGKSDNPITLATINKFKDWPEIRIVSEKDNGIYDAMNKGIQIASGDYVIFLNSGDTFYNDQSIELFSNNHNNDDIVYGNLEVKGEISYIKSYPSKLSFGYFLKDTLPHPACFIKKTLFSKCGQYEPDMSISADWAFFIKAICLQNASYKHIPYIISTFYSDGVSSLAGNQDRIAEEKRIFLKDNFPLFMEEYLEAEEIKREYNRFKNSRLRKLLSFFLKSLQI